MSWSKNSNSCGLEELREYCGPCVWLCKSKKSWKISSTFSTFFICLPIHFWKLWFTSAYYTIESYDLVNMRGWMNIHWKVLVEKLLLSSFILHTLQNISKDNFILLLLFLWTNPFLFLSKHILKFWHLHSSSIKTVYR